MHKSIIASIGLSVLLAGCAVGPNYKTPTTSTSPAFYRANTNQFVAHAPEVRWWRLFNDSNLNELIEQAARRNHDVRIASARLDEARALRRGSLWAFAPGGGVSGQFERRRLSAREMGGMSMPNPVGTTWSTGFDATWEIDVFGRLRRGTEAASAEVGEAQAQLRDVQVGLLAEVAANYFSLRGVQQRKALLEHQRSLLARSLETTQKRVEAGRGTQLDTARAEAFLKETEAALPVTEREESEHLHRLAVLLGETPGAFTVDAAATASKAVAQEIAIGSPGDLLRRRADIAAAERQLAKSTALIGVRTAEMFPEISVSGFIRFVGGDGVSVGSTASRAWSMAPSATWHFLNLGRLNASRRAARSQAEGTLANYEQTILRALEDVENSLARYRAAEERLRLLAQRQAAAERALRIAKTQYDGGLISALEAIEAERTAVEAARETIAAATEHRLAVVSINKALGGGWEDKSLFATK